MSSKTQNFEVPLPTSVRVHVEENVFMRDFSGYLTRAIAWTALTPLFMLAFMHFSQLMNATEINDSRQIEITEQIAKEVSSDIGFLENFIRVNAESFSQRSQELSLADYLDELNHRNKMIESVQVVSDGSVLAASGYSVKNLPIFISTPQNSGFFFNGNYICYAHKIKNTFPAGTSVGTSLIGCMNIDVISEEFKKVVGIQPFSLQVFTKDGEDVLSETVNAANPVDKQKVTQQFLLDVDRHINSPRPLWRTDQTRNRAQVLSVAKIPAPDWYLLVGQPVAVRDEQLLSSLLTSGAFLLLGLLGTFLVGTVLGRQLTHGVSRLTDQINEFKNSGKITKIEQHEFDNAPLELKMLSSQFETMANVVISSQEKLKKANERLTEQVNLRTASLNQRNRELKALQQLLSPLEEPAVVVIKKTIEQFKEILEIPTLYFVPEISEESHLPKLSVKSPSGKILGYLYYDFAKDSDEVSVLSSLLRLAHSISIVLDNQNMFTSIKIDHSRFTALTESMSEGIVLIGLTGSLLYANKTAKALLGLNENDAVADVSHFISKTFRSLDAAKELKIRELEPGKSIRLSSKTDSNFFIEASTFIVPEFYGYQGQRTGLILRDISKEVLIERMKKNLISVVAHELKTPVTTMRLQAETLALQNGKIDAEQSKEMLHDMLQESQRLQTLISDWLDVSRLESGSMVIKPKIYSLQSILRSASNSVKQHYPALEIISDFDPNARCVIADKDRLTQVFINILDNAARYRSEKDPCCTLRSVPMGKEVEISFEDNGIGIDPTNLSKVFDSFYQVNMTASRRVGGTGLGLAICRGIIAAHGGRIWAENNPLGGTTFKIRLPM